LLNKESKSDVSISNSRRQYSIPSEGDSSYFNNSSLVCLHSWLVMSWIMSFILRSSFRCETYLACSLLWTYSAQSSETVALDILSICETESLEGIPKDSVLRHKAKRLHLNTLVIPSGTSSLLWLIQIVKRYHCTISHFLFCPDYSQNRPEKLLCGLYETHIFLGFMTGSTSITACAVVYTEIDLRFL
jgi:hypothetical protein